MPSQRALSLLSLGRSAASGARRLTKEEARKFLLTASAPAIIQPEEADELIDYVIDISDLLQDVTVWRMDTNEQEIRFLDMDGGILRQIVCGAAATESVDISNTNKCLRTVSLDAKFYLCDTDIEDNLIGAELERKVLRMAADRLSNEIEFFALMGNTNGSYTKPSTIANSVISLRDGYYRQLQFGNILDANAVDPADRTLSFHKLNCLERAIPDEFADQPEAMRIYMPRKMWFDYAERHQGRETALGDSAHLGPLESRHLTTPIRTLRLLPTDIQNCGCGSVGGPLGTFMFLTNPANLIWGIQREIQFERERVAREHRTWFIYSLRMDFLVLNEEATSLMDCMTLINCGPGSCSPAALANRCNECIDLGSGGEPTP
jgi:hypothetical protein